MHARITDTQAKHLASLMAALHPGWDIPGCRAALWNAKDRADAYELTHAAIELAKRSDLRTPSVLAEDGPHWGRAQAPSRDEHRFARCPVIGHSSNPAHNCGACKADAAESAGEAIREQAAPDPEQLERNARWARKIQADRARRKGSP